MTKGAAADMVRAQYPDLGAFEVLEVVHYDNIPRGAEVKVRAESGWVEWLYLTAAEGA